MALKGVILAGGTGSRLNPWTLQNNKHLAPVYSQDGAVPMIFYPIETLLSSGVTDILIISSQEHSGSIIEVLGDGDKFGCDFTYKIQDMNNPNKPVGIASALRLSQDFVGNNPFAVILGDNFYHDIFLEEFNNFKFPSLYSHSPTAQIFLKKVHDPERFGVATIKENKGKITVTKIVEKPEIPETNYAVTGLYLYTPHVFTLVPELKVSARGELEITDINNWYVNNGTMSATELLGFWHDCGTPNGIRNVEDFLNERVDLGEIL